LSRSYQTINLKKSRVLFFMHLFTKGHSLTSKFARSVQAGGLYGFRSFCQGFFKYLRFVHDNHRELFRLLRSIYEQAE
jgi:hypothetical protein